MLDTREALRATIHERAIAEHHDRAQNFDALYETARRDDYASSFAYGRRKLQDILDDKAKQIPAGGRVLDIGCGTGEHLRYFQRQGFSVSGIEPAANMRAIAQRNNPGVDVMDGTITQLPFATGQFDMVLAIEVLRYLDRADILQAYSEMARITKPGGLVLFTMVNRYALNGFYLYNALHKVASRLRGGTPPIHCEFTTPVQVKKDCAGLGLGDVECLGRFTGPVYIAYKIYPRLGARVARILEPLDDRISEQSWSVPLAGHLIVTVRCK